MKKTLIRAMILQAVMGGPTGGPGVPGASPTSLVSKRQNRNDVGCVFIKFLVIFLLSDNISLSKLYLHAHTEPFINTEIQKTSRHSSS